MRFARLAVLLALVLAGCPMTTSDGGDVVIVDMGSRPDLGLPAGGDLDGDGLCNGTELRYMTDPSNPDTDGDGFPDWVEVANHTDATVPADPPREMLLALTESPTATVAWSSTARVSGEGATYFADFLAGYANDAFGTTASAFYTGTRALDASPRDNVGHIDMATGQFQGVVGTTQLFFVSDFAYGTEPTRACLRMYNFYVRVKTDTGIYVASTKGYLLVGPTGATPATGPWCTPSLPCQ